MERECFSVFVLRKIVNCLSFKKKKKTLSDKKKIDNKIENVFHAIFLNVEDKKKKKKLSLNGSKNMEMCLICFWGIFKERKEKKKTKKYKV